MSQIDQDRIDIAEVRKKLEASSGKQYWQSLDELAETEAFQDFIREEFPRQAAPLANSLDRRGFLKLLGASLAFAGLTACAKPRLPNEKIVPYVRAPEEIIPGKPLFFATSITQGGYALGLLAESHQGRPTKVEGNPDHPASLGATDVMTQASVLGLYDPDRSQQILEAPGQSEDASAQSRDWEAFTNALNEALGGLGSGQGLYILSETVTSPTLARQLEAVLERYPNASWHQYDPLHSDNAFEGAQLAFGQAVQPVYDFSLADIVLSLDADFLGNGPGKLRYTKDFSRRRRVLKAEDDMNRLYALTSVPSQTSSVADHRISLRPSEIEGFTRALAAELGVSAEGGSLGEYSSFAEALIEDLEAHRGSSLVVAGDDQPAAVHALAYAINDALGNVGTTIRFLEPVEAQPENHHGSLGALVQAMQNGDVAVLLMLGGNPVYSAPADQNFAVALENVSLSIHLSQYLDETSVRSSWHIPETHYLESWGDARAYDGTISLVQPLIQPFYGGKSAYEVLAAVLGSPDASSYDLVRDTWRERVEGNFGAFWQAALYKGSVEGSAAAEADVSLSADLPAFEVREAEGLELIFRLDPSVLDGRFANNGWLLEVPKPFTKLTWDNAALIGPTTAEDLGLRNEDVITISAGERRVNAPVWIFPGVAPGAVALHLGYGRSHAGRVGNGIGFNAYELRSSESPGYLIGAEVSRTGERHQLVSTQMHYRLEGTTERRHILRHGTLADFKAHPEHPEFVHPVEHPESNLYPDYAYDSYAWGMVIDMNVCTSCNACVVACQSENNIPIVGKDQVAVGREMHWIRVDTYYGGDLDNPEFYSQPLPCMHCEQAPCEPVCPFGATVHDNEGLNVMVYNRCGGTRYCSNNCPYKVRRYNFLQYAELANTATELSLAYNPDVTVRSRGVMEKCSYCTQRIQQAYITAENENRKIQDGEVVTACQSACPAEAIVFGDLNTEGARVNDYKASKLNYGLLEELNTKPRTTYITKLTNPNPLLAGEEGEAH